MPPFNSNLLNSMVTIKTSAMNRANQPRAGVVEAIVMSSSPLLQSSSSASPRFQINVQVNNKLIELVSPETLKAGSTVQLKINNDSTATIIKVIEPNANNTKTDLTESKTTIQIPLRPQQQNPTQRPQTNPLLNTQSQTTTSTATTTTSTSTATKTTPSSTPLITTPLKPSPAVLIETGIRQSLPIQQPLKSIIPLLVQLTTQTQTPIPKEIINNLNHLISMQPTKEQLGDPKMVKRSLLNSGSFLEAKLSTLLNEQQARLQQRSKLNPEQLTKQPSAEHYQQREAAVVNADTKAKTQQLIQQIEQTTSKAVSPERPTTHHRDKETGNRNSIDPALLQQAAKMQAVLNAATKTSSVKKDDVDIMLQQLGKQLLSTLAKTQLNQLETLNSRTQNTSETNTLINSWTLETPIMHGKHADNLELQIREEEVTQKDKKTIKQWTVMLDFDLHSLGKMSVELCIIDKSVSATVWSEKEKAHSLVRHEIENLRNSLQKIGVNVKKVDCLLGVPEKNSSLTQQLVDIHT